MSQSHVAPLASLVSLVVFGLVAFGWRVWLQYRRTGDAGIRCVPRTPADWAAGTVLVSGLVAVVLAPIADLAGLLARFEVPDRLPVLFAGAAMFLAGFAVTVRAQLDLGNAWRIGVDRREATPLVTEGFFRLVRNPVFSGIGMVLGGLALLVPNALSAAGWLLVAVGLEIQVRLVEEPHLMRRHGDRYRAYAAAVGRFLPGVGRLGPAD